MHRIALRLDSVYCVTGQFAFVAAFAKDHTWVPAC